MKVYISGKIGSLNPQDVYNKFKNAQLKFESCGCEVINPQDIAHDHDKSWASYMLEDLKALVPCDTIAMLPCWVDSPGAKIELAFAQRMGKKIIYL